jgi:hypothetical protein
VQQQRPGHSAQSQAELKFQFCRAVVQNLDYMYA